MIRIESYDVAVVGGGPAGLFATKHLLENLDQPANIALLEMGPPAARRRCPADHLRCKDCSTCTILSGIGGGGLHSDGKLILDLSSGGYLHEFADLSSAEADQIVGSIRDTLISLGGRSDLAPRLTDTRKSRAVQEFAEAGFSLALYDVLHMGTTNLRDVTLNLIDQLESIAYATRHSLSIESRTQVLSVEPRHDGFALRTRRGTILARKVILAVGKSGAPLIRGQLDRLGCSSIDRPTWLGVRVEADIEAARDLLTLSFDPKISRVDTRGRRVKTHCFCRDGSLLVMKYRDGYLVGGHSPDTDVDRGKRSATRRVNFNVLASTSVSQGDIDDMLIKFRDLTGPTVAVQDMRGFLDDDAELTASAVGKSGGNHGEPVNIRHILDQFGGLGASIADFMFELGQLQPGLVADANLVYAPALEWDYGSVEVSSGMETAVPGLFAVGDGAGISQGVVHAAASGIVAATEICTQWGASRLTA